MKKNNKQSCQSTQIKTLSLFKRLISKLSEIGRSGTRLNNFLKIVARKTPDGWLSKILYWILFTMRQIRNNLFQGSLLSNIMAIIKELNSRLLLFPKNLKRNLKGKDIIWINAGGMGEWNLIKPLLKNLKKKYPNYAILLSCPNRQGFNYAQKRFTENITIYTPFNIPVIANKFLNIFRIKLLIMIEIPSQIGIHLIKAIKNKGGISVLFNGRIPDERTGVMEIVGKKAYKNDQNREIFSNIDYLLMQNNIEAKKIIAQGANESNIYILGNIKYDTSLYTISSDEKRQLYQILKIKKNRPILLAGSIHSGEYEIILNVFQELKKKYPSLLLIIAPRNLVDIELILNKISSNFVCFLKTQLENNINFYTHPDIVILDTLGELKKFYSISTISILCGSFLSNYTGHNPLEPANFAKPIIFGHYMKNFATIAKLFVMKKGAFQVKNQKELLQVIKKLMKNINLQQKYGKNAYNLLKKNCGALKRTITVFDNILKQDIKK